MPGTRLITERRFTTDFAVRKKRMKRYNSIVVRYKLAISERQANTPRPNAISPLNPPMAVI